MVAQTLRRTLVALRALAMAMCAFGAMLAMRPLGMLPVGVMPLAAMVLGVGLVLAGFVLGGGLGRLRAPVFVVR